MSTAIFALLVATWAAPAAAQNPDFCYGVTAQTCGNVFTDGGGSGEVERKFDLSSLCKDDGNFYYDEDTTNDHQYAANVCGKLANECQVKQFCNTKKPNPAMLPDGDAPWPVDSLDTDGYCLIDTGAVLEGMVKQYGFSEECKNTILYPGNVPQPQCSKCSMMARGPQSDKKGVWGKIKENGEEQSYKAGVQVTWPIVEMSEIQQRAEFGKCKGGQEGYQTTMIFECDCDQTSFENNDVFDQDSTLGLFLGKLGDLSAGVASDGSIPEEYNCMYTLKFKHRNACYAGYCDKLESGGFDDDGGLGGGSKFLIVVCVFTALYLITAYILGIKRNKATGEVGGNRFCPTLSLGTYAMYQFVTCNSSSGSYSGGAIPGQSDYSASSFDYEGNKSKDVSQL